MTYGSLVAVIDVEIELVPVHLEEGLAFAPFSTVRVEDLPLQSTLQSRDASCLFSKIKMYTFNSLSTTRMFKIKPSRASYLPNMPIRNIKTKQSSGSL